MADENNAASQLREKLLDLRNRERNTLEKYSEDLTLYLSNKLSDCDVPIHTIMEIAQFATLKAQIFVIDEVKRQQRLWEKQQMKVRRRNYNNDCTNEEAENRKVN